MADANISELLCFLLNNYGKTPSDNIKVVTAAFYNSAEIVAAKNLLFECADKLALVNAPRRVYRRKADDKARLDVDDIFALLDNIDEQNMMGSLPTFVALNLDRIPPLKSDVADLFLAVKRISDLEAKVDALVTHCMEKPSIEKLSVLKPGLVKRLDNITSGPVVTLDKDDSGSCSNTVIADKPAWADLAKSFGDDDFTVVSKLKSPKRPPSVPVVWFGLAVS
jgi:hypothetical protein